MVLAWEAEGEEWGREEYTERFNSICNILFLKTWSKYSKIVRFDKDQWSVLIFWTPEKFFN